MRIYEVLDLEAAQIDFDRRVTFQNRISQTKRCWVSFFNEQTGGVLLEYIKTYTPKGKLFSNAVKTSKIKAFGKKEKINAQTLRRWFCCEMARLGVPDRYVDAFCGIPRSVLARHYRDFSPERLKEIYDKADLRVL